MQGHRILLPVLIPGTLAANITIYWKVPFDVTLKHISAVATNDSDATLIAGVSGDTDSILASCTIGDSAVPVEKTVANWATTNPTGALSKGDIFVITLDFDGAGGTAAQNVSLVFTFLEG